jgi:hypothetical protein
MIQVPVTGSAYRLDIDQLWRHAPQQEPVGRFLTRVVYRLVPQAAGEQGRIRAYMGPSGATGSHCHPWPWRSCGRSHSFVAQLPLSIPSRKIGQYDTSCVPGVNDLMIKLAGLFEG